MSRFISFSFLKKDSTVWPEWPGRPIAKRSNASDGLETVAGADLYAILQIECDASQSEIRDAYRKLAKSLHPDLVKTSETGEEGIKRINAAYRILGNPDQRAKYNKFRQAGVSSGLGTGRKRGVQLRVVIPSIALLGSLTAGIAMAHFWFANIEGRGIAAIDSLDPFASRRKSERPPAAGPSVVIALRSPVAKPDSLPPTGPARILSNGGQHPRGGAHSPGRDAADASSHADQMAWMAAEREGARAAYRAYLEAYPRGRYATRARNKLAFVETVERKLAEDDADWSIAERHDTAPSYRAYLKAHPRGRHAAAALRKLVAETAVKRISALLGRAGKEREIQTPQLLPLGEAFGRQWLPAYQSFMEPEIGHR